jgi:hypothetical protein
LTRPDGQASARWHTSGTTNGTSTMAMLRAVAGPDVHPTHSFASHTIPSAPVTAAIEPRGRTRAVSAAAASRP